MSAPEASQVHVSHNMTLKTLKIYPWVQRNLEPDDLSLSVQLEIFQCDAKRGKSIYTCWGGVHNGFKWKCKLPFIKL